MSTRQKLVHVGKVANTHGLRGELKVREGEGASGAWHQSEEVFIGDRAEDASCFRVVRLQNGGRFVILALAEVEGIEKAKEFKGKQIFVPRHRLPDLEDGVYYSSDLVGMMVVDGKGRRLGVLKGVFDNGAHEIYAVEEGSREILIPVIDGVVVAVDPTSGRMVVEPPEGLPGLPED